MVLLKHRKMNHFVREINRPLPVFAPLPTTKIQENMLKAVVLLAKQIDAYVDLTSITGTVNILIAGSDRSECTKSDCYKLLNKILGTEREWNITLVGLEIATEDFLPQYRLTDKAKDERVTINLQSGSLSAYLNKRGYPDILVLNHPGFEEFAESWFENDTGIADCLKQNIPVIGASYGIDEYQIDDFYLQAYGLKLADHQMNELCLRPSQSELSEMPQKMRKVMATGICDWGRTIWQLEPNGFEKDHEKFQMLDDFDDIASSICQYLIQTNKITIPQESAGEYIYEINGEFILRVYGQYSLNVKQHHIFNEENGRIMSHDVEIECDPDASWYSDFHKVRQTMIHVYRTYIKPNFSDAEHIDEDASETNNSKILDLLTKLGVEDYQNENGLQELMNAITEGADLGQLLGFKEKRAMTSSDQQVLNLANDNKIDELLMLPIEQLKSYQDDCRRNLAHLAAMTNNLSILQHANNIGIPFDIRDADDFSFLDTAVEYGSLEVIKASVQSGIAINQLNDQNTRGFTPLHQAVIRNNKAAYDLLIELGANDSLKNIAGLAPRDNSFS